MNIGGVTSSDGTSNTKTANKTLDSNAFLQLLVQELSGQNPTSPVDDKELFQQIATMTNVQGISEMRTALQFTRAQGLMGHKVEYNDADGKTQTGVVKSLTFSSDQVLLDMGDAQITLDQLHTDLGPSS